MGKLDLLYEKFNALDLEFEKATTPEECMVLYERYETLRSEIHDFKKAEEIREKEIERIKSNIDDKSKGFFSKMFFNKGYCNKHLEYLKSYNPEDVVNIDDVEKRKKNYSYLRKILKLANPYKFKKVRRIEPPKGVPIIYTPSHGFKDDLINSMIMINDPAYILFGSIDQFYYTIDGILANMFGVAIVDRDDKLSRDASLPKMQRAMSFGINAIIFPEGAWNLTDNELIMKLFPGFYRLAKLTGAMIVPVVTHIVGKKCYVIQDKAIDISKYEENEAREILRDTLATLRWELMRKYSNYSHIPRSKLEKKKSLKEQWEDQKQKLKKQVKYYIEEKEIKYPYKDKSIVSEETVFAPLDNIKLTQSNALILSKTRNKKK